MDAAQVSHYFFAFIGLMTVGAVVGTAGALFAMGRAGKRKD